MPGAWEIKNHASVLVGILHTETTSIAWAVGLRKLKIPGQVMPLSGMPFDHARNVACMRALELGATHLFFLDSDVIPPEDAILRLIAHDKPIISGMYCRRSNPAAIPVMIRNGTWVTEFPKDKIIEVDLVGAGCLLIQREVLEKMPAQRSGKHWFDWRVDMQGILPQDQCLSEDFTWCRHAKEKMGIPILVDTSIQCKHVGFAEVTYGRMAPLEIAV